MSAKPITPDRVRKAAEKVEVAFNAVVALEKEIKERNPADHAAIADDAAYLAMRLYKRIHDLHDYMSAKGAPK